MADTDWNTIIIVVMLLALAAVLILELRLMRKRRTRVRVDTDISDRAHNTLLTTKAIADAVARGGVRSAVADGLIQEAEAALRERNYRTSIDFSERAKDALRDAKARHQARGDIAKLDEIARKPATGDEVTDKERIAKDLPPNFTQARFSMGLADEDIATAKVRGADTGEAERILAEARGAFDRQDYAGALAQAVHARRSLQATPEPPKEPAPPRPPGARTCGTCGAPIAADDTFCRSCGAKFEVRACASCGAEVARGDAFCRKCGTKVSVG